MKKAIALILAIIMLMSFTGCDLWKKEEAKPVLPEVDPNAPVYMNASGVITIQDVKRKELADDKFMTVSNGFSTDYNVKIQVVLDMKDNNNNKIDCKIYDRINKENVVGNITYNGKYQLFYIDFSSLGLGIHRYENFNLAEYIKGVDFSSMIPPEFADMVPEGFEIEIDFEKVDMMDYLMSILYSMDTTALVITDQTIVDMKAEKEEEVSFNEPFAITVGVFSNEGLFDSLKVNYALSGTMVAELKIDVMQFHDGTIEIEFKENGTDIKEDDLFAKLKSNFKELKVGDGFTATYELQNGFVMDSEGNPLAVQNEIRVIKRSMYECEINVYQKIVGDRTYNHLFEITTADFETWEVTMQEGMAYVIEDKATRESMQKLIGYLDEVTILSDDLRIDRTEEEKEKALPFIVYNYNGLDIKQSSTSSTFTYYLLAQTINDMQKLVLQGLVENGYEYDQSKGENINDAIARSVMDKIGEELKKDIEQSLQADGVLGDVIGGILGDIGSQTIDSIYEELSKGIVVMISTLLDGIYPLPELDTFNITVNFGVSGLTDVKIYGENKEDGGYVSINYVPNMAKAIYEEVD